MINRDYVINNISAIAKNYSDIFSYVVLFGSVAKNTHHEKSDIDLYIQSEILTSEKLMSSPKYKSFIYDLYEKFKDIEIDRICHGGKRDTKRVKDSQLWREIQSNGVVLYDKRTNAI